MTTQAEAPSESWLALPAVMQPPSRTGLRPARPSSVVVGRLPSSFSRVDLLEGDLFGLLVHDALGRRQRNDLVVEAAGFLSGRRALLALQRVLVLRVAADVVALGHDLGGVDHRHVDVLVLCNQPRVRGTVQVHVFVLHQADRLEPAADDDIDVVADHGLGRDGDGHQARRALAIDGHACGRYGQAGGECDSAARC